MAKVLEAGDADQEALDERIDRIVAAHGGDWRAALEVLLIAYDDVRDTVSNGYVRGRFWRTKDVTERDPLTPWALRDRLERHVAAKKGVRLTWETTFVVLEAVRAYIANPRRDRIAGIICMRHNVRNEPCDPLCRRCSALAWELKCLFRGVPNPFGDGDFYDGGSRKLNKSKLSAGEDDE